MSTLWCGKAWIVAPNLNSIVASLSQCMSPQFWRFNRSLKQQQKKSRSFSLVCFQGWPSMPLPHSLWGCNLSSQTLAVSASPFVDRSTSADHDALFFSSQIDMFHGSSKCATARPSRVERLPELASLHCWSGRTLPFGVIRLYSNNIK